MLEFLKLFFVFFKIGVVGFGGGYAMLSMIMSESASFAVTVGQFADLNAVDMLVPGPIAINAATYVGYLHAGVFGALFATIGVSLPSLIIVPLVMRFLVRFRENKVMNGFLLGVKPAAVGLVAAAALTIALGVLVNAGTSLAEVFANPLGTISFLATGVFIVSAVANIRFRVSPILLIVLAGIIGAIWG